MKNKNNINIFIIFIFIISSLFMIGLVHCGGGGHDHGKISYTCPMHPQIIQDRPGSCPICGMALVPVKRDDKDSIDVKADMDKAGLKTPSGLADIKIKKLSRDMIGVKFESVQYRQLKKELRIPARILADETRLYRVTVKIDGYIEKLYVNQTGQFIKKGSPLCSIYSPELVSAQQEYISALKASVNSAAMKDQFTNDNMTAVRNSSRERLRLLDMSDEQINEIEKSGVYERAVTLYAPSTGYVIEKMVLQGQKVMMNEALMIIADLSSVWGEAEVFESDLPYIKTGIPVKLTLSYWPGKIFRGRIGFIYPMISEETRTLKVRMEIANPASDLKIGMYADAQIVINIGNRLSVSESAVMKTGVEDYVFVDTGTDTLSPKKIQTGLRSGDGYYEVYSGLKAGERVVTAANFLIDSESSMKGMFNSEEEKKKGEHAH
jgi:RND family efflux transporter MFP subunit